MRFSKLFGALLLLSLLACSSNSTNNDLPKDFVYLKDIVPSVVLDIRYYGTDNFVGKRVNGYEKPTCIVTNECASQLKIIAKEAAKSNYRLKVFDSYRPQRAVDHFSEWALDLNDTLTKAKYYPEVKKSDLFRLNYIASKSGHSRGSTIDLTLIDENGNELDMGSSWDYFGTMSWPSDTTISEEAQKNRLYLRTLMLENGFNPYNEEWWHFTLKNEPYPETYFDFIIK
jgi:D-alanyl-D-alanine dipeptidase